MSKRILIIDNDNAIQKLFAGVIANEGWEVFCYSHVYAHLKGVQELTPDLIILGLNSDHPERSWLFLQVLQMEDTTARIPVVVCTTSSSLPLEIEGYLATRHISIVRQPFDNDALIMTIRKNLAPDTVLPILVVEDNEHLSEAVVTVLQLEGYLVATASSDLLALDAVAHVQYPLIILDIVMRVRNGLEFLAAYAQQPVPHSPVIILSAQTDLVLEQLPAFVIDILPKPYELSRLIELVSKIVKATDGEVGL